MKNLRKFKRYPKAILIANYRANIPPSSRKLMGVDSGVYILLDKNVIEELKELFPNSYAELTPITFGMAAERFRQNRGKWKDSANKQTNLFTRVAGRNNFIDLLWYNKDRTVMEYITTERNK